MGTTQVNMHEAKSRLSELGELAQKGEKIVIAKAGKPYLDLLPHREHRAKRTPGRLSGQIRIAADFDQTPSELGEVKRRFSASEEEAIMFASRA